MKVTKSTIEVLTIQDVPRLDPVRVMIENTAPSQGRITIECYGQAWSAYWGAMGEGCDVSDFVRHAGVDYIVNCLERGIEPTRVTGDSVYAFARQSICQRRRRRGAGYLEFGSLDAKDARALFDSADELRDCETQDAFWNKSQLLTELFGQEWFYYLGGRAEEPNPKYEYLQRIVKAVQQGLVMAEEPVHV